MNGRCLLLLFGSGEHLLLEVHLVDDDFIPWVPDVLTLDGSDGRIGLEVINAGSNAKRLEVLLTIKEALGDLSAHLVSLAVDALLESVDISVLYSLDDDLLFRKLDGILLHVVGPSFELTHIMYVLTI